MNSVFRDFKYDNVMMDPTELYSVLSHPMQPYKARDFRSKPIHTTRTLAPVKYYLLDFGHSKKFDLSVPPEERLVRPRWGAGDKSIPEFAKDELCDPFAVDVYCVGNMIRCYFLDVRLSLFGHLRTLNQPLVFARVMIYGNRRKVLASCAVLFKICATRIRRIGRP